jgi:hypothetical protein
VCCRGAHETVLHRFWECASAKAAWQWGIHILNTLVAENNGRGPWRLFFWKQGIFSNRIPRKFDEVQRVWMAMCGIIVWTLWTERNDVIFNDIKWSRPKLLQRIWLGLIDFGRLEWESAQLKNDGKFEAV